MASESHTGLKDVSQDQTLVIYPEVIKLGLTSHGDHIALLPKLGLSAFGRSQREAMTQVEAVLHDFAEQSYREGTLFDRLARQGVRWEAVPRTEGVSLYDQLNLESDDDDEIAWQPASPEQSESIGLALSL